MSFVASIFSGLNPGPSAETQMPYLRIRRFRWRASGPPLPRAGLRHGAWQNHDAASHLSDPADDTLPVKVRVVVARQKQDVST